MRLSALLRPVDREPEAQGGSLALTMLMCMVIPPAGLSRLLTPSLNGRLIHNWSFVRGVNSNEIDTEAGGQLLFNSTSFREWIGSDSVNWNINWKVNDISQLQVGFLFIPVSSWNIQDPSIEALGTGSVGPHLLRINLSLVSLRHFYLSLYVWTGSVCVRRDWDKIKEHNAIKVLR